MALTRANVEAIQVKRTGPLLTVAGMAVTVAGANADLNDPIGRAVRDLGYTVTDIATVADADVAQVTVARYDEFLLVAELHTWETILGNLDDVDIVVGPRSEKLSQTAELIERKLVRLYGQLQLMYNYGLATPTAGYITLTIAEHE